MQMSWRAAGFAIAWMLLGLPAVGHADDRAPSIVGYGINGFWNGALIGLSVGYLATGDNFEDDEWKKLAFGAGIGALSGAGLGIGLGIADTSTDPPPTGWLVLRDVGYGTTFGALVGTAVGALFMIDSERPKDLLIGASAGAVVGATAGIVFGIVESINASNEWKKRHGGDARSGPALHLALLSAPGSLVPLPGLAGRF